MSATETERLEALRSAERPALRGGSKLLGLLFALIGILLVVSVATIPLEPREQAYFALGTFITFMIVNRFSGRGVTMFLIVLSLAVSLRYIFWRVTETLDFGSPFEFFLGTGLVLAEAYAILVLVLGYVQSIWPLNRKPMPLPDDPDTWPTVDVYVPTYNEPMSIVRATVLAAMSMDWPRDKMKVYILDDGRREEFREFAEQCGCGYVTRNNNAHAKAGNLNHAMTVTDGEFICIFDCDHIPTRAFLQMTLGWLVFDKRIALVQTPHHFYSPDPFQRNLAAGTRVPSEANMFYGLVQDGNDYWNAAFFCGSCAVIRRKALEEINGFAVETVTEDAHTMLKLARRGWHSAYVRLPLAAGLATERLMLHIGQRFRWARGMIQILRIDNPLLGPGLTIGQRLCYLAATVHFLFAIPRIVFLTSPLAFLLLGQNIITASPLAITAYALPHIFHSVATNSRTQENWRHSFWSEIYETVLALFLVRVTLVTLVSPRRGKFNVTAKGGLLENGFFDLSAVYPNLILTFLLIAGMVRGLVSLIFFKNDALTFQALTLNSIWATFSLLAVLAALAVGRETRQIRSRARINARVPVEIQLPDGRTIQGFTRDLSQGGGSLEAARPPTFAEGALCDIEFQIGEGPVSVPASLLRWDGNNLQVRWEPTTIDEESRVVQAVFGRADAWTDWANYPKDRPMASLWRVLVSIRGLFRPPDRTPSPRAPSQGAGGSGTHAPLAPPSAVANPAAPAAARTLAGSIAAAIAVAIMLAGSSAVAQQRSTTTVRPIPQAVVPLHTQTNGTASQTPSSAASQDVAGSSLPPPPLPSPVPSLTPSTSSQPVPGLADTNRPGARRVVFSMRQLGAQGPLALRGTSELQGVEFGIRSDEVVTSAQLSLNGAMSPNLIPEFSNITVTLNEQYVGTVPVNRDQPNFQLELPVSPVFFQDNNRLNFRFTGRYTPECNDPLSGLLWATVYDNSTLTLTLERLPPQRDLAKLPLPFFDQHEKQVLSMPFVLPANPSNETLRASGIMASWFGQLAAFRGANFPVVAEPPAQGNAVMVVLSTDAQRASFLPPINGPTVAVIPNPNDGLGSVLVIAGRTGEEIATAARVVTLGSRALGNDVAVVQPPDISQRRPYDAPNWIATDRAVKFGELVDTADLQSYGYVGLLHVPFRTAPDFYTWRNRPFPMLVKYRGPPGPIIDVAPSRLDIGINGIYLDTVSLGQNDRRNGWISRLLDFGTSQPEAQVGVPTYDIFGQNDLQFYFDARPLHRGDCVAVPNDLRMSIDPDSTIDLSRGYRFTSLPNLAFFVNSGFPFSRMADLSETAVVIADKPTSVEVSSFLALMGRMGALTGYPVVRVTVVRPDGVGGVADKDLLVIGTLPRLQGAGNLFAGGPLRMTGNRLDVALPSTLDSVRRIFGDHLGSDRERAATRLSTGLTEDTAVMLGSESPLHPGRSLVAIVAAAPQGLDNIVASFRDTTQAQNIQGDLSIITGGRATSYRVGDTYTTGTLPFWLLPSWWLRDQPFGIVLIMLAGSLLCCIALYWTIRRRAGVRMAQSPSH